VFSVIFLPKIRMLTGAYRDWHMLTKTAVVYRRLLLTKSGCWFQVTSCYWMVLIGIMTTLMSWMQTISTKLEVNKKRSVIFN